MIALRVLLILACAVLAQACGDRREQAGRKLRKIGAPRVRQEAALLYKDMFARHGRPDFTEIWYKNWPRSFQEFKPLHVGAYLDGFTVALVANYDGEQGLFVVPASMDHEPRLLDGVTYQKLEDGIYWYSFGSPKR